MTVQSMIICLALTLTGVITGVEKASAGTILGTAEHFAVLGAASVVNTGSTTVYGDLGVSPGNSITGAGSITLTGTTHNADGTAQQARIDATTASVILAALSPTSNLTGQDLGGLSLGSGVYFFSSSAQLTGTLTIDFAGVANRDVVFQIGSALTTASGSNVIVQNGSATNGVFFQIGTSATLGTGTTFAGNIVADDSVTLNTGSRILCGRALALNGSVTMGTNTISNNCFGVGDLGSGISDYSSVGLSGGDFTSLGYTAGGFDGLPSGATSIPEPATVALVGLGFVWVLRRGTGHGVG